MNLTWRDGVATTIVAVIGVVSYAVFNHFSWVFLSDYRWASLTVLLLGFATCVIVGAGIEPSTNRWTITATTLGILAIVAALAGIIFPSAVAFAALVIDVGLLWLLTTVHHAQHSFARTMHA